MSRDLRLQSHSVIKIMGAGEDSEFARQYNREAKLCYFQVVHPRCVCSKMSVENIVR